MTPKTEPDSARLILDYSRMKLTEQYWPRLRECVGSLTDQQIWWRPNPASNSVGNLLLHLNGNVRQWLVTSFNKHKDSRDRPAEFNQREQIPGSALLAQLGATLQEASEVISRLTESDLTAPMEIQGYKVRGLEAVYHVVEHFAQHYGQILYITKMLRDADLGFYRQLNATGRLPKSPS
jgi:uncharacterized damage-inducible protein DinB